MINCAINRPNCIVCMERNGHFFVLRIFVSANGIIFVVMILVPKASQARVYLQQTWTYAEEVYTSRIEMEMEMDHDDVIKWRHFPRCWPFVQGIHRSPVNSPHKGQYRGAFMFSFIWVKNHEAGELGRHRAHYDFTVMSRWNFMRIGWSQKIIT